jgi:hypothetical protein
MQVFSSPGLDSTLNKILSWDDNDQVARILLSRLVAHENDSAGHSRPSFFNGEHYRTKKSRMHTLLIVARPRPRNDISLVPAY